LDGCIMPAISSPAMAGWLAHGKKHSLNLRGELHIPKKVVSLLLYRFGKQFPLVNIPPDDVNDE